MLNDVRFSIRILRKSPVFFATGVLSLALGIGAGTTMFSAFRAVFLRPLPFKDADRLVEITKNRRDGRPSDTTLKDVAFWREFSHFFERIGTYGFYRPMTMAGGAEPANVVARVVEKDFFATLMAPVLMGRVLEPADFDDANPPAILLSSRIWREDFQGDPGVVGRRVTLDSDTYTVAGIMPDEFKYPSDFTGVWIANRDGAINPGTTSRGVVARLKPGVAVEAAQAELERMRPSLEQSYPAAQRGFHVQLDVVGDRDRSKYRASFLVLCGAVGMLVLIACLNVANLIVARSVSREGEFAVRSALGAGRGRLVRQVLVESFVLATTGGALGALLAYAGNRALVAWLLPAHYQIARLNETHVDSSVLAFAGLITSATAILFGLGPAIVLSRFSLREFGRTTTQNASRARWRAALIVSEIALSLAMLIGSGLLIRSFIALTEVSPGFRTDRVLTMMVPAGTQLAKDKARLANRFTGILARVAAVPEVLDAALATAIPMGTVNVSLRIELPEHPGEQIEANFKSVSSDYFSAIGIPLRMGRVFTPRDDSAAPLVTIVNEAFARKYWPGQNPIGKIMNRAIVVGMVADVHSRVLSSPAPPEFYSPYLQYIGPSLGSMLIVRTRSDPARLAPALRDAIHRAYPDQPVSDVETMQARVADSLAQPRLYTTLLGLFAGIALLLTAVGIYGVVSHAVGQRTREFGIRIALGARRADVLRIVMNNGLLTIGAGCVIGMAGALALKRYIESLLFGVTSGDPAAFIAAPALLIAIAAAACYLPARRATSVDPNVVLRDAG